ncbi:MAG: hypothetical protein GX574_11645 [Lentisphaerae bacterium]|nr:hypothetical protein [Lentisphaerota bacterium]HQL87181.1 hypothetical protein [Lentisphaeria bacterium]
MSTLLLSALSLPTGAFAVGPCPEAMFLELTETLRDTSPEGEHQAGVAAYAFLSPLGGFFFADYRRPYNLQCWEGRRSN